MRSLLFIFLLSISFKTYSQSTIKDSEVSDTGGFYKELTLIEQKLGKCPDSILNNLQILNVRYYGFDEKYQTDTSVIREGVLLLNKSIQEDLKYIFEELLSYKFPIKKVVPINKYGLNSDTTGWNDILSMEDNNTSAFNYRLITLSSEKSPHALGTAIDFNPLFNPFEKYNHDGKFVEPEGSFYDLSRPGTISDGILVGFFDKRGWVWGGRWNNPVDYQHFDLRENRSRKHYLMKDSKLKNYFSYEKNSDGIRLYSNLKAKKTENAELTLLEKDYNNFQNILDFYGPDFISTPNLIENVDSFLTIKQTKKIRIGIFYDGDSLMLPWNKYLCEYIINKLHKKGFDSELLSNDFNRYDILLGVGLGNRDMFNFDTYSDDFHVIYVPGAFREKDMKSKDTRLQFLNLLISDDFTNSIDLAIEIQNKINEKLAIPPVSRQLKGPNILESECIKSDIDGIYCRKMKGFNHSCPSVFISAFSVQSMSDFSNWILPENSFNYCKKLGHAIIEGLENYLNSKNVKN